MFCNLKWDLKNLFTHPVQVPRWPFNFAPGFKTKFKDFSREIYIKKKKSLNVSIRRVVTWPKSKAQEKHLTI